MPFTNPLIKANGERWKNAKLTRDFSAVARRLASNRQRYEAISARTTVPWQIIAVIHEREASGNFSKNIAQGDDWNKVSVHVPRGRGPFDSFEDAAFDALVNCDPKAASWRDWSPGGALTLLEQYNGLGYFKRGLPSPYLWSGTDQYVKGKFVADGQFDPNAVDQQLGCAGLLMALNAFAVKDPAAGTKKVAGTIAATAGGAAAAHQAGFPLWAIMAIAVLVGAIVFFAIHFHRD